MSIPGRLKSWLGQHARAAIGALGRLRRRPGGTLMTTAAVGIALALPAGFLLAVDNLDQATTDWDGTPRLSVFLERSLASAQQSQLRQMLSEFPGVASVSLIDPATGLEALRRQSGMDESLTLLDENPLPPVLEATLDDGVDSARADALIERVRGLRGVAEIRLDRAWLERLQAIMALAERAAALVALLLGLTVALVVGNTIRLDIANARSEIEISKLIGGTDAFVRRPFLYTGLWYGLAGGLIATCLLGAGVALIAGPAAQLAALYGSPFRPAGPGLDGLLTLIMAGTGLGLLGAWLAVARHLADIEPEQ